MRPYLGHARARLTAPGARPDQPDRGRRRRQRPPRLRGDQERPRGRRASSSSCPSSASRATRPRTWCCAADFLDAIGEALEGVAAETEGITALVGFPERIERPEDRTRNPIIDPVAPPAYNSLAVCAGGGVTAVYRKSHLPNYAVFDERRYFEPGPEPLVVDVAGVPVGLTICEDIWVQGRPRPTRRPPARA